MPKRKRNYADPDPVISTFDFTIYPNDGAPGTKQLMTDGVVDGEVVEIVGHDKIFRQEELAGYMCLFEMWMPDCTRIRVAKEVCPKTGREHLQCKLTWRIGKRWAAMKKIMGHVHFEPSASKCFSYCAKVPAEGEVMLLNHDSRKQGNRSDLQRCIDSAAAGATTRELFTDFGPTMVRYQAGIDRAKTALKEHEQLASYKVADFPAWEPITDWTQSVVLVGPSGVGKTEFALAHFKNPLLVSDIDQLLDFDEGTHDGIVFDDMDFTKESRNAQISIADQTMHRAIRCRYRSPVIPRATKKVFTCNNWCLTVDDAAIKRRCRLLIAIDRDTALVTQG